MANFLERAIATVAPRTAVKRAIARRRFEGMSRSTGRYGFSGSGGYEGSAGGRRTQNWRATQTDANAALNGALSILRARSRDLCRNNPYGMAGISTIEEWTVGCGIHVQPLGDSQVARDAQALWRTWGQSVRCDADQVGDLGALQGLVIRTVVESGSALIRRRYRFGGAGEGLAPKLQIQVLEPDHLDLQRTVGDDGNRVTHGVELNSYGRRVAYWLFPEHPGSSNPRTLAGKATSSRVPAEEIAHVFLRHRPGQMQAAPWLTPALLRMRSLDEYEDAELLRMVIASNWAGFVTTDIDPDDDKDPINERIEDVQPGMIEYLRQGETIHFPDVPSVSGRDSYTAGQLRAISSAIRVPYESLTNDLTKVNYSSGRLGFNAFERRTGVWQKRLIFTQMMAPVWDWFIERAIAESLLPAAAAELKTDFTPPGRMILDPDKEGKADFAAIRNGVKTLSEVLRGRGKDPEEHLRELAADFELLDQLGLKLDCDPRNSAAPGAGAVPDSAESDDGTDERPDEEEEVEADDSDATAGDSSSEGEE